MGQEVLNEDTAKHLSLSSFGWEAVHSQKGGQ